MVVDLKVLLVFYPGDFVTSKCYPPVITRMIIFFSNIGSQAQPTRGTRVADKIATQGVASLSVAAFT